MLNRPTLRVALLSAAGFAWLTLTGCASGPLTMDFQVVGQARSLIYHLDPDGQLTVSSAGGMIGGESSDVVYRTRLSEGAMEKLKQVVFRSGFLVAEPPYRAPMTPTTTMLVEVELGLWHNRMDTRGARVESVSKIVAEVNRHLPSEYVLPDTAAQAVREEQEFQKYLEEMRQP